MRDIEQSFLLLVKHQTIFFLPSSFSVLFLTHSLARSHPVFLYPLDVDNSGTISNDELKSLFTFLEIQTTDEELNKIIELVDVDRSGTLSFEEFVTLIHLLNSANEEEEEGNNDSDREAHLRNLKLIFDTVGMRFLIYFSPFILILFSSLLLYLFVYLFVCLLDTDHSGSISTNELGEMFSKLGYEINTEELVQLIALVDDDKNGTLEFEEFIKLMDLFLQHLQNS